MQTAQQLKIDEYKRSCLPDVTPPISAAEKVERKHSKNTCTAIIHKSNSTKQIASKGSTSSRKHRQQELFPFACKLVQLDRSHADEECPHDILMERKERSTYVHKIERYLGDNGKYQHTEQIFFQAFRVKTALNDHECKNGKRCPANAGEPIVTGDDRSPHMIAQHKQHCNDMQRTGAEIKRKLFCVFVSHNIMLL